MIVEGEAIALRPDGTPLPFQTTMRRFGRRLEVERMRAELPVTLFLFDILYLDGDSAARRAAHRRRAELLAESVPAELAGAPDRHRLAPRPRATSIAPRWPAGTRA